MTELQAAINRLENFLSAQQRYQTACKTSLACARTSDQRVASDTMLTVCNLTIAEVTAVLAHLYKAK